MALVSTSLNGNAPTVVNGDDFAEAMEDARVAALVEASLAYGTAVAEAGHDHSLGEPA